MKIRVSRESWRFAIDTPVAKGSGEKAESSQPVKTIEQKCRTDMAIRLCMLNSCKNFMISRDCRSNRRNLLITGNLADRVFGICADAQLAAVGFTVFGSFSLL
jgi:hypothetical protein